MRQTAVSVIAEVYGVLQQQRVAAEESLAALVKQLGNHRHHFWNVFCSCRAWRQKSELLDRRIQEYVKAIMELEDRNFEPAIQLFDALAQELGGSGRQSPLSEFIGNPRYHPGLAGILMKVYRDKLSELQQVQSSTR